MAVPTLPNACSLLDGSGLMFACCIAAYACMLPLYMCADSAV